MLFLRRLMLSAWVVAFLLLPQTATAQIPGETLLRHIRPQLILLTQNMGFLRGRPVNFEYVKKVKQTAAGVIQFVEEWYDVKAPMYDSVFRDLKTLEAVANDTLAYWEQNKQVDRTFLYKIAEMDRAFKNLYGSGMYFLTSEFNAYYGGETTIAYQWQSDTVEGEAMLRSLQRSQLHIRALRDLFHTLQNDTEYVVRPQRKLYCFGCSHADDYLNLQPGTSLNLPYNLRYYKNPVIEDDAGVFLQSQARPISLENRNNLSYHMDSYQVYDVNKWSERFAYEGLQAPGYQQQAQAIEQAPAAQQEVVIERRRGSDVPPLPNGGLQPRPPVAGEIDNGGVPATRTPRAIIEDYDRRPYTPIPRPVVPPRGVPVQSPDEIGRPPLPAGALGRVPGPTVQEPDPIQ